MPARTGYEASMPLHVEDKCLSCRHRTWAEFFRELSDDGAELADEIHEFLDGGQCSGARGVVECTNSSLQDSGTDINDFYKRGGAIMSGQLIVRQAEDELAEG